jgi:hypothetical protein
MRWPCSCLLAAALLVAGAVLTRLPIGAAAGDGPPPPSSSPVRKELRGAGSCAAAACHNGNGAPGEKGSEYTTWVLHDPHSHAFEVLYGERSLRIEKNRQRPPSVSEDHPESDSLCLNCHVMPSIEPISAGGEKPPRRKLFGADDGVSCEACHGAAGGWLTRHYTAEWRGMSPKEKSDAGMTNTKDLRVRAELCVRCHVGTGEIDVNHDLIAAGHPRLAFEYAAFHANMPKHWDIRKDREGRPDFEARLWAMGQVESAKAALELLAHRADAKNERPWPEFAEHDCFACHHDLKGRAPLGDGRPSGRLTGLPAWGTWYFSMLPDALGEKVPEELAKDLSALRRDMEQFGSERKRVAETARSAAERLKPEVARVEKREYDGGALDVVLKRLAADERHVSEANWDGAAQLYLALGAAYVARGDVEPSRRDPRLKASIRALGEQLSSRVPAGAGQWDDTPPENWPQGARQALEGIRQGLRK